MTDNPRERRSEDEVTPSAPDQPVEYPPAPDAPGPGQPYAPPSYGAGPDQSQPDQPYAPPSYGAQPDQSQPDQPYAPPSYGAQPDQSQPYAAPAYGAQPDQPYAQPGYGTPPGAGQPYAPPGASAPYGQPPYPGAGYAQPGQQTPYPPVAGGYGAYPAIAGDGLPPKASWGKRALGALLDFIVPGMVVSALLSSVFRVDAGEVNWVSNLGTLLVYLALAVYSAKTGQTWGRQVAKTQLVGADGKPIGLARSFLRYVLHILDSLPLFIGWLWPIWDKNRQTFADKIMSTYVVDVTQSGPINVQP